MKVNVIQRAVKERWPIAVECAEIAIDDLPNLFGYISDLSGNHDCATADVIRGVFVASGLLGLLHKIGVERKGSLGRGSEARRRNH